MNERAQVRNVADREQVKDGFPGVFHFAPQLRALELLFEGPVTVAIRGTGPSTAARWPPTTGPPPW